MPVPDLDRISDLLETYMAGESELLDSTYTIYKVICTCEQLLHLRPLVYSSSDVIRFAELVMHHVNMQALAAEERQ